MENCGWEIDWLSPDKDFQSEVHAFQAEWEDDKDWVWVQTSGSTGAPKPLQVEKQRMLASAQTTLSFLGLNRGDSALLCLPVKYIAGKMMLVRAWWYRLSLWAVAPSSHPLAGLQQAPVFAAMTPMQVIRSLQVEEERNVLREIRQLIIGGGAVEPSLAAVLRDFPYAVWSTYGMTETLSHIALRRLSGPEASGWYEPFEGVQVSLSEDQTLRIQAPAVCSQVLQTNDIAELRPDGGFRILGRKENVINSGGVKIQIEQLEEVIRPFLTVPFQISSVSHPVLGEETVLLLDRQAASAGSPEDWLLQAQKACERLLPPYWKPLRVMVVEQLPWTETGKPSRAKAKELAALLMRS